MAIVKTVNFYDFERAFVEAGRSNQFSYEGKQILFDYLENLSEDIGEPIELDVISLCCEYTEYTLRDAIDHLTGVDYILDDGDDGDDIIDEVIDALSDETVVLGSDWTGEEYIIIVQSF